MDKRRESRIGRAILSFTAAGKTLAEHVDSGGRRSLGGQIFGKPNELGQVKEGYLADLILVDGDPVSNIRVLQDKSRILAIMKDGEFHKAPDVTPHRQRVAI